MELNETQTQGQGQGPKCVQFAKQKSVVKSIKNGPQMSRSSILKSLELGEGPDIKRSSIFKNMEVAESELNDDYAKFENMGKESRSCVGCNGLESTNHCNECDQFLCSACFANHTFMKSTPAHALTASEDMKDDVQICAQHERKKLSTLCVTCDMQLCTECINPTHTGHELKELSEIVQDLRQMLHSGLEKFSSYHKKSEEAQGKLASRALQIFGHEAIDCIEQLKTERLKLVQSVYLREIQLRKEILAKAMAKKQEIHEKQNLVKSLDWQVGGYLDAIPELLKSNDNQLLQHRKILTQQCAQLEKAATGLLDQESFNYFVESGFSLQISLESFPEISKSMKSLGCLSYTNGNIQDKSVPTGSRDPATLQRVLLDLQEEMCKTVSYKRLKCPATEKPPVEATATPKPIAESNEIPAVEVEKAANGNEQQLNNIPQTNTIQEEDMETSPVELNGGLNTENEKNDSVHVGDTDEEMVEKYEYLRTPFDDDDDGSSRDSDYDPILQTARNESQPRRQARRVSTDTLNSTGGGQVSYDSDSDYSAVAVADKIKEWTKRSTDELKSDQAKAESYEEAEEPSSSKASTPKSGRKKKVENEKNDSKVPATPRVSRSRPHEISPNYQGRAQRNSRGRVPKNLEGFAIDLPGRSPEKAKPPSTNEESTKKGRRRLHANDEQKEKEEPSSKKPKPEPTSRVSTRRNSTIQATQPENSSVADDLKAEIEPKPPKPKRGRKLQTDESSKPSPSPKAAKATPAPKSEKTPSPLQIAKRTRAAKAATTQVEKSTEAVQKITKAKAVKEANAEKSSVPSKKAAKIPNPATAPKPTKAAKDTKPKNSPKPPAKNTAAPEPKREARGKPKIRIDQNNGVTTELDYPLTPTATDKMKITFDDSNEDYCTVCLDGGGVLICCDVCPKVFHGNCHLPAIKGVPEDDWQCLFCTKKEELGSLTDKQSARTKYIIFPEDKTISDLDFIYLCKFISELFKCKESLVVRGLFEKLLQMNNEEEPVHLNYIRTRVTLQTPEPFANIKEIICIIRKMFGQAKEYYPEDTECGKRARIFEKSFNDLLAGYYPGLEETVQ